MTDELALAIQHKEGALRELEKVQAQLYAAQDDITALTQQLGEKKHSEQLGAWAIDRAVEVIKLRSNFVNPVTAKDVTDVAAGLTEWVMETSAAPVK